MEYVYTALLLHAAGKDISEQTVTKVLEAAGEKPDSARVKALVASLKDVNIEETLKNAATVQAAPAQPAASGQTETKKEEKVEEKKTEAEAAEGLGSLFG